jgi:hypothetical protein
LTSFPDKFPLTSFPGQVSLTSFPWQVSSTSFPLTSFPLTSFPGQVSLTSFLDKFPRQVFPWQVFPWQVSLDKFPWQFPLTSFVLVRTECCFKNIYLKSSPRFVCQKPKTIIEVIYFLHFSSFPWRPYTRINFPWPALESRGSLAKEKLSIFCRIRTSK